MKLSEENVKQFLLKKSAGFNSPSDVRIRQIFLWLKNGESINFSDFVLRPNKAKTKFFENRREEQSQCQTMN